ncbi:MAG TPA: hypothetical protein VNJ02_12010 [Vicinamibacterales bacterium]|nr:hypothetical protein [Vicinamibacterales bacterium]
MSARQDLLRQGALKVSEIADFAADAGNQNFLEAEEDVSMLLDHEDPIVRFNALAIIAYEWGRTSRAHRIVAIMRGDVDVDCRRQAAAALGALFRGSREEHVLKELVFTAKNPQEPRDVRASAYVSALDVVGVSRTRQPNVMTLEAGERELAALDDYLKASEGSDRAQKQVHSNGEAED